MYLFRCVPRGEITNKMNDRFYIMIGDNTHNYKENIEYRNFFKYSKDAEFYFRYSFVPSTSNDYHIGYMVLEIDEEIVEEYKGYGIYNIGKISLDEKDRIAVPFIEYAIPDEIVEHSNFLYFENIPEKYKNDEERREYIKRILELYKKYNGDYNLIIKEISNRNDLVVKEL